MAPVTTDTRSIFCNPITSTREVMLDIEQTHPQGVHIFSNLTAREASELRDALDTALAELPPDPDDELRDKLARTIYKTTYDKLVLTAQRSIVDAISTVREAGR